MAAGAEEAVGVVEECWAETSEADPANDLGSVPGCYYRNLEDWAAGRMAKDAFRIDWIYTGSKTVSASIASLLNVTALPVPPCRSAERRVRRGATATWPSSTRETPAGRDSATDSEATFPTL